VRIGTADLLITQAQYDDERKRRRSQIADLMNAG